MTDNVEQIARDFFATLSTGDLEKLRPLFHPDATWTVCAKLLDGSGSHHGRDTIIDEFLAPIRGMFRPGDPKLEITNMISSGDQVAVETHTTGTFQNGNIYDNEYAWILAVKDGMVYSVREYMDTQYAAQAGD